jgi:hypothetical protein
VPTLLLGLLRGGDAAWQVRLACVLAMGPRYPAEVARDVGIALAVTGAEPVRRACEAARVALLGEASTTRGVLSARAAGHG